MERHELDSALRKAKKNDPDGLAILFEHFYPKILKYLHYRVGAHEAEDLTADVFLRMLKAINRQRGSFTPWLYTIARNAATDHFRSARFRRSEVRATFGVSSRNGPALVVAVAREPSGEAA